MQPVVMLVIAGVAMFSVIGGVSLLSHYYTLNGIKSRTVGDGQHGTARFATKKEIAETYVQVPYEPELWRRGENLPAAQGLVLGSMERAGKLYALVDTGDVHCLMIGAAGVGKTAHFLYPNIEYACACGMSFLTTDTKGDLYRNYAGIAKKYYGYHTAVIDLRNPTRSDGDNMLHLVNKYMDEYLADHTDLSAKAKAEKYAKITAKTIISSGGTDKKTHHQRVQADTGFTCTIQSEREKPVPATSGETPGYPQGEMVCRGSLKYSRAVHAVGSLHSTIQTECFSGFRAGADTLF